MSRAVIITGGTVTDYAYTKNLITKNDTIICADSGYDHASAMGITPHVLLGDLDSIKKEPEQGITKIKFPTDKDYTDTELALNYAKDKGFERILLLGAIGTRMDHTLVNIQMLARFSNATIINENNKIYTGKNIAISEKTGTYVSLLPMSTCTNVNTKNLQYQLTNATLQPSYGLSVSNVMVANEATVTVGEGIMTVIVAWD